jgi:hypothetical protein
MLFSEYDVEVIADRGNIWTSEGGSNRKEEKIVR